MPALTLQVSRAMQSSSVVHVTAAASGINPVAQMQVWLNGKEIYHVAGQTLNANITLPAGSSEKLVVEAIDSTGKTAKVANTIAVN